MWLSDRYTAQQGHGAAHQTCLAHLARDVAYALEVSQDPVPWRLQLWLQGVFALAEWVTSLAVSTLSAERRALDQQLAANPLRLVNGRRDRRGSDPRSCGAARVALQGLRGFRRSRPSLAGLPYPPSRERWFTPDGHLIVAPLPSGVDGHFGPELRRFVLGQYHQGQVILPRLVAQLRALSLVFSTRQVMRLLIHSQ